MHTLGRRDSQGVLNRSGWGSARTQSSRPTTVYRFADAWHYLPCAW